jgi:hypothetical protein
VQSRPADLGEIGARGHREIVRAEIEGVAATFFPEIAHPPFLVALEVPNDRSLRIVVEERTGHGPEELDALGIESREIVRAPDDRIFEIVWDIFVCFAMRGDPFPKGGPSIATICEVPTGDAFLDWVKAESFAEPDYVAAMQARPDSAAREVRHWRVSCNEALFDIASPEPPIVRQVPK